MVRDRSRRIGFGPLPVVAALVCAPMLVSPVGAVNVPLQPIPVSATTGEKPQSKVWHYAGTWWAVLPTTSVTPTGTWLWRLESDHTWTSVLRLSASTGVQADAKRVGNVTHILLHGSAPQLVSVEYVPATNTYVAWSVRPTPTSISLSGSEIATIDIDSTGRMWLATESGTNVHVHYADSPYAAFTGPIALATNIATDDIAVVTALPDATVGVLWSNQATQRFGFKRHVDGADPTAWSADEVPADGSALPIGAGMADDHLNVAVATDGTLYAAVKTSYDSAGYAKIALLVRRPNVIPPADPWDPLYTVDTAGTRGIVLLNESTGTVRVIYTASEGANDIVYRESALSPIAFGTRQSLMAGSLNDPTSTKEKWGNEVVVLASGGGSAPGVLITSGAPTTTTSSSTSTSTTTSTSTSTTATTTSTSTSTSTSSTSTSTSSSSTSTSSTSSTTTSSSTTSSSSSTTSSSTTTVPSSTTTTTVPGFTDRPIDGRKLVIKRSSSGREKAVFVSKDPNALFPTPEGSDDPTSVGATVEFVSGSEGTSTLALPAGNWTLTPAGTIYKFKNKTAPDGTSAVKVALVKQGRGLKVVAKAVGLPLAGVHGSVGIRIRTGMLRHCARFGGTILRDEAGKFIAKDAVAADVVDCSDQELGSPSGAFLEQLPPP